MFPHIILIQKQWGWIIFKLLGEFHNTTPSNRTFVYGGITYISSTKYYTTSTLQKYEVHAWWNYNKFAVFLEYEKNFGSILLGHFIKHEPLISKEYSTSNVLKSNTQIDIRFFILQIYFCPTAKYDMDKKIAAKNSWNFCTSFVSGFHRGEFFYRKYAFVKVIIIQGSGQILVNSKSLKKELYEIKISQNLENSITKIYKPKNNFRFRNLRNFPSN